MISTFSCAKIETYSFKYFLILAAELAKIKFLKSRKKPTLSDVLNFASLFVFGLELRSDYSSDSDDSSTDSDDPSDEKSLDDESDDSVEFSDVEEVCKIFSFFFWAFVQ